LKGEEKVGGGITSYLILLEKYYSKIKLW
jgi:hypothetical protein